MKKTIYTLLTSFFALHLYTSQNKGIGINTANPQGILHTDGLKDNPASSSNITSVQQLNDVLIDHNGRIGVGTLTPNAKVDLRNSGNGAIGIGNSTLSANIADGGAVRYNNGIEYSNGQNWYKLLNSLPQNKILVIATKTNNNVKLINPSSINNNGLQNRQSNYLVDWTKIYESNSGSTFNASTGVFTAPRDGVYVAVYTVSLQALQFNFDSATTQNPLQTEAIWQVYDNTGGLTTANIVNTVKCANTYSSNTSGGVSLDSGSYCSASLYMQQGQRLMPYIWFNLNSINTANFSLNNSGGYNNLTITEQ